MNHTVCTLEDFPCMAREFEGIGTPGDLWSDAPCSKKKAPARCLSGWKSVGGAKWGETTERLDVGTAARTCLHQHACGLAYGPLPGGVLSYANCSAGTNHGKFIPLIVLGVLVFSNLAGIQLFLHDRCACCRVWNVQHWCNYGSVRKRHEEHGLLEVKNCGEPSLEWTAISTSNAEPS